GEVEFLAPVVAGAAQNGVSDIILAHHEKSLHGKTRGPGGGCEIDPDQQISQGIEIEIVEMMRRRKPPIVALDRWQCGELKGREIVWNIDADDAARLQQAVRQRDQMRRIGNMLQHIVEMRDVEAAERAGAPAVEESLGDGRAQIARMRRRLARRLDAAGM